MMLDGVTINQLRAFVAVCEEGSFSGAARHLKRAQSAISHAVAALENALQVELFERDTRKPELSAAGRNLLPDARAVIARTEEMKSRAAAIVKVGVPEVSFAADVYFPREHLASCLHILETEYPTATVNLRMTTMRGGEDLVADGTCCFALTIDDVPKASQSAIERRWLFEVDMITVCGPTHALATSAQPVSFEDFGRHVQLIVTDNQPEAEKSQMSVAGKRQWLVNDLSAKHDLLKAGLCWGHMPTHLVADDVAAGRLVELERRAWHIGSLPFMISRRRGYELTGCEARLVELLSIVPDHAARAFAK